MNRHLAIVSAAFTWAGALLGLPSLSALLYFLWALVGLHRSSPAEQAGGKTDYNSLIGLLVGAVELAGKALKWLGTGLEWAIALLAVFSLLLLVIAVALFVIGRGLHAHETWARILGIIVASVSLFAGVSCALSLRQAPAVAAALAIAASSTYFVWALWREFV